MFFINQHIFNDANGTNLRVCYVSTLLKMVALADMTSALKSTHISKPISMKFTELSNFIKSKNAEIMHYDLPLEITKSDNQLVIEGRETWIKKRDEKFECIRSLIQPDFIESYLFGAGLFSEIEKLTNTKKHKSRGVYYAALNRYITFGCTINALLPFRLKNTGSNYLHNAEGQNIKRGKGGKDNEHCRSKTKGVTVEIKNQIFSMVRYAKKKNYKKIVLTKLFSDFQKNFETADVLRDGEVIAKILKPENDRISYDQFYYHFHALTSREDFLRLVHGDVSYEKDFAPKSGVARDGVVGPSYRYEVDSTILDLYVRYPYDTSHRYTMGRPILYVVVDVFSTCIVGFYLGFSGPNWAGASEALVNACMDKVAYCASINMTITEDQWPCSHIPVEIAMDNGTDYPLRANKNLIQSLVGIQAAIYLALYRGDAKAICERKFGIFNDQFVHYEPGSIFEETRREDVHPSNEAVWDLDALKRAIVEEIIFHNNNSDRLRLHNFDLSKNQVGLTPNAIYQYCIDREMNGGRKTTERDIKNIRWALLEELQATVDEKGVYLQGIYYDSDYIRENNWPARAAHNGRFKIFVRRSRSSTNYIWYRADSGEIITLHIKEDESERYAGQHWECALHRVEQYKQQQHELANQRVHAQVNKENFKDSERKIQAEILAQAPENTRKSAQPEVKDRARVQANISHLQIVSEINKCLTGGTQNKSIAKYKSNPDLDIDNEFYKS